MKVFHFRYLGIPHNPLPASFKPDGGVEKIGLLAFLKPALCLSVDKWWTQH